MGHPRVIKSCWFLVKLEIEPYCSVSNADIYGNEDT